MNAQMNANGEEEQKKVQRLDVGKWVSALWHDDEKNKPGSIRRPRITLASNPMVIFR